jgi:hypothetical protein
VNNEETVLSYLKVVFIPHLLNALFPQTNAGPYRALELIIDLKNKDWDCNSDCRLLTVLRKCRQIITYALATIDIFNLN